MVPSADKIRGMADPDHHVVLQFPATQYVDKTALIRQLAAALPEYSVFDSGGDKKTNWVTIMPVVGRPEVIAHTREIEQAARAYIQACAAMLAQHTDGRLPAEWSSYTHGGHRRFENSKTGQVIEAPLGGPPDPRKLDPYFFALFAKSTPGQEVIARLIRDNFHDAARMIDIVFKEGRGAQPGVSPLNGGPDAPVGNSGVSEGPPSVS